MPSKKKPTRAIQSPPEEVPEAPKAEEVNVVGAFHRGAQIACGHINKQFINSKGQREDLACTLPKGHAGDHFAKFQRVVTDYGMVKDDKGVTRQEAVGSHIEEDDGWWSDAAGEFPAPRVITPEEDFKRLKETRARERSSGGVDVDEAISSKIDSEVRDSFGG